MDLSARNEFRRSTYHQHLGAENSATLRRHNPPADRNGRRARAAESRISAATENDINARRVQVRRKIERAFVRQIPADAERVDERAAARRAENAAGRDVDRVDVYKSIRR